MSAPACGAVCSRSSCCLPACLPACMWLLLLACPPFCLLAPAPSIGNSGIAKRRLRQQTSKLKASNVRISKLVHSKTQAAAIVSCQDSLVFHWTRDWVGFDARFHPRANLYTHVGRFESLSCSKVRVCVGACLCPFRSRCRCWCPPKSLIV